MTQQQAAAQLDTSANELVLDFDSDEPLPVCPMRKDGMASDEICEACQ